MEKLCVYINNAYASYFSFVFIPFKKKYLYLLDKLLFHNLISYEITNTKYIKIYLRYYYNKPLFFLKVLSTSGNKLYLKTYYKKKNSCSTYSNIILYSTSYGIFSNNELILNIGGKDLIEIKLLSKNILK